MNRLEALGVLTVCVVGVVLAVWLYCSLVRGRRRVPERLEPVSMGDMAKTQDQLNRLVEKRRQLVAEVIEPSERALLTAADLTWNRPVMTVPGVVIEVDGDPRDLWHGPSPVASLPRCEARERMAGVLDDDPPDWAGAFDRAYAEHPPSLPGSPWAEARPWAHA